MAQGRLTLTEYMEKQQQATMELSFSHLLLPKEKKDDLVEACIVATKSNPLLLESDDYKAMFPNIISGIVDLSESDLPIKDILDKAVEFLAEIVEPLNLRKENDKNRNFVFIVSLPA